MHPFAEIATQFTAALSVDLSRQKTLGLDAALQKVFYVKLRPGFESEFKLFLTEFAAQMPRIYQQQSYFWFRIEDGGESPQYVLLLPQQNFADAAQTENLFERIGNNSNSARKNLQSSAREISIETWRFRRDLSLNLP